MEALDHSVPDERMQPEVCGTFHLDEFDPGQIAVHPPHIGLIDRQRLGLIGEHEAQCNTPVCQQRLISFDRASHRRKIRNCSFADCRGHTVHGRVSDLQAIEAALVGSGLFHRGAECTESEGWRVFPNRGGGGLVVLLLAERAPSEGPRSTRAIEDQPGHLLEKQTSKLGGPLSVGWVRRRSASPLWYKSLDAACFLESMETRPVAQRPVPFLR